MSEQRVVLGDGASCGCADLEYCDLCCPVESTAVTSVAVTREDEEDDE